MSLRQAIASLNPQQLSAVKHKKGPMLVLAGAGSGKTQVATLRVSDLIEHGVPHHAILGITFTNKAAQGMKARVERYVGKAVLVSTFHSLGARILRESIHHLGYTADFAIYDEDDTDRLFKECMRELGVPTEVDVKQLRAAISNCKNNLLVPTEKDQLVFHMYERYNAKLKSCNAVDFDDLLYLPTQLFEKAPEVLAMYQERWQYILVDEYQDTNVAQYIFVKHLAGEACNLFVVGDPDQSIYSWRGANIKNILNFEKDFPGAIIVRLEQNYRSTSTILQAANAVIQNNSGRYEKNLWSALGQGEKITFFAAPSERQEAFFVAKEIQTMAKTGFVRYDEVAIFYRTNFQSRVFEDELIARKIPYTIVGGVSFYQRKEIKDILSILRLVENPKDLIAFLRVINLPKRGIGDTTLAKLVDAQRESGLGIMEYILKCYEEEAYSFTLTAKQKEGIKDFAKIMLTLRQMADGSSLEELVRAAVYQTRYVEALDADAATKAERLENVEELIVKASEWEMNAEEATLSKFLEELALVSAHDHAKEGEESISMMTIHNGKGLEYKAAFLVGLEEDLFPHINSKKSEEQIEEERRLFYVGITRAKERLYISLAQSRSMWGSVRRMRPSRFLQEVPPELRKIVSMTSVAAPEVTTVQPKSTETFEEEAVVMHPQFGIGKVLRSFEGSLGLTYDVYFTKDNSTKRLVAKYAPLTRLAR